MAKDKATKQAERAERQQLKSAQNAEIKALKSAGVTAQARSAEKEANAAELQALLKAQKSGTYTPTADLVGVRSAAATYSGDVAAQVGSLLNSAAQNYADYNISTINKSGNVTTGVGLDKLVDYELGQAGSKFNTLMSNAENYVGKSFSLADLEAQGITLRPDKSNPGFFKSSIGSDGNKDITYFTQNPDGTYTGAGINRVRTEAQDQGFFSTPLGQIALGVASFYFGVPVGSMLGLSGTAAGVVGGGLLGGTASVLGGGKFGQGALTGALGGFSGAGGFEGLLGSAQPAPVVDATYAAGSPTIPGLTAVQPTPLTMGAGITGAPVLTPGATTMMNGVPVTTYDIPFDPKAYADYAGIGGALKGISSLGSALGGTVTSTLGNMFGGGINPFGGGIGNYIGGQFVQQALAPQVLPEEMGGGGGYAGADPRYEALIAALAAPRIQPRSLV